MSLLLEIIVSTHDHGRLALRKKAVIFDEWGVYTLNVHPWEKESRTFVDELGCASSRRGISSSSKFRIVRS